MKEVLMVPQVNEPLQGSVELYGAKNAVLVIMVSVLLTHGKSRLYNVPASADVLHMVELLQSLGAEVYFNTVTRILEIDTSCVNSWYISPEMMKRMRASVLVLGPLLARFDRAEIALPGGDVIGSRPIDYHIKGFSKMGATVERYEDKLIATHAGRLRPARIILEYPSVGATENILLASASIPGTTTIINAALEPEVLDLVEVLRKMGSIITIAAPAVIHIEGNTVLQPIEHEVIPDRLEAGSLLCAAAITGGEIYLEQARADHMELFLQKLQEMGHHITIGPNMRGVHLQATKHPVGVSFKTGPYPGFPTDLQPLMMALQAVALGESNIEETVYENRLIHVQELRKMGAQIRIEHNKAYVIGVEELYGTHVIASDIRASCALVLAGLVAQGTTTVHGVAHWYRGYDGLEKKLNAIGSSIVHHYDTDVSGSDMHKGSQLFS